MKIYLASSWKNSDAITVLAFDLRADYDVDAFTDTSTGRYVFHFSEIGDPSELNCINFLRDHRSKKAFNEDKKWLDWCDVCILCLPAGKSSHLEAGYAKGCGKKLIIFHMSGFPYGEFDVMYGFADFMTSDYVEMKKFLVGLAQGMLKEA